MELTEWDVEQAERLLHGNKNAGYLVETKTGLKGRTYHNKELINGKAIVYTEKCNFLCNPDTLKVIGYID